MRLFLHQFRKDLRHTWIVWLVWLLFVVLQFGLAAWNVGTADPMGQGIYGQLSGLVPLIHSLLLFVLVPALLLQEPTVGVTAFWLTRPMPRITVLGSKLLALFLLVLIPLIGQCAVLASHGLVPRDVVLAGIQIGLNELSWIALVTVLAALSPNFGWFLIASVVFFALRFVVGWVVNWFAVLQAKRALFAVDMDSVSSLPQSQAVAGELFRILFALGIVLFQYLTRRTRVSLVLAGVALLGLFLIPRFWPWDFLRPAASAVTATKPFDAAGVQIQPNGNYNVFDQPDWRGGSPLKTMNVSVSYTGIQEGGQLNLSSKGGDLLLPGGSKLALPSQGWGFNNPMAGVGPIEAAIGYIPLLSFGQYMYMSDRSTYISSLYSIDVPTFSKNVAAAGEATFRLKGYASHYRIASELPLHRGATLVQGSARTTLTEILHNPDGVDITLTRRTVQLLLRPQSVRAQVEQPVYLLVNRKRGEAAMGENTASNGYAFNSILSNSLGIFSSFFGTGDSRIENVRPVQISFGPMRNWNPPRSLPVALDDAWLADASLVTLEQVSDGTFETTLRLSNFTIDGKNLSAFNERRSIGPDTAALNALVLPEHPTRPEVWSYLMRMNAISQRQQGTSDHDPQIALLRNLGPEHAAELLIAISNFQNPYYYVEALRTFDLRESNGVKEMVLRLLPQTTDLIRVVTANHWEADVKPILFAKIANQKGGEYIDERWISALASLRDPATYDALTAYVEARGIDRQEQYLNLIRAIPGPLVAGVVDHLWKKTRGAKGEAAYIRIAAKWGLPDALDRAAEILAGPVDPVLRSAARDAFRGATPCPDRLLDGDIVAWYAANKEKIAFDPILGRFVYHAAPTTADQAWPLPYESMRALGVRAAGGDRTAVDEIDSAYTRVTEGLDPKLDKGRIDALRAPFWSAFDALQWAAAKDPAVFRVIEYANEKENLHSFTASTYSKAAAEGNAEALDALIHYADHHWTLLDALNNVSAAVQKNNPQAIDFVLGVLADPAVRTMHDAEAIHNKVVGEVQDAANAGSAKAKAAYEAMKG
jgi:hypothetical protein